MRMQASLLNRGPAEAGASMQQVGAFALVRVRMCANEDGNSPLGEQ
jgi:hypothetical protein